MKNKIKGIAKKQNAIILAHNYQPPEIQDIADMCGDSLELSIKASKTDADIIVFCGVHFMAETASILSPDKKVLLPKKDAGCPMADMITSSALKKKIAQMPFVPVVTYVNSSAKVKALSTICCTSANALKVVESLEEDRILMVPDKNLAMYVASKTDKEINLWDGYCPVHNQLTKWDVIKAKDKHPEAIFMAHPECRQEVLELADEVLSTSGMIKCALKSNKKSFIVGTEIGLIYAMKKVCQQKEFYPVFDTMECQEMKKISLEDVVQSLEFMKNEVNVPENIRESALKAVKKMLNVK